MGRRHGSRFFHVKNKKLVETLHRAIPIFRNRRVIVDMREEKFLQRNDLRSGGRIELSKTKRHRPNVGDSIDSSLLNGTSGRGNEIGCQVIDHAFQRFVELRFALCLGIESDDPRKRLCEKRYLPVQLIEVEKFRFHCIVEIRCVVGDFIHSVYQLRFERGPLVQQVFIQLGEFVRRIVPRMFNDSFADLKGEIQTRVSGKTLFELLDNSERMEIVVKTATVAAHQGVEAAFAGVAKRGVANVVDKRKRLSQVCVQPHRFGDGASDLRNFKGVGESIAKMVGVARGENLRFRFQAAKGARMNDAVAVARKFSAIGMSCFRVTTAA